MERTGAASDETLLAAHRDGDPAAFETLFRRYERALHRHLARMLGDPAAAEDLVIETFQRLHAHRDGLRPGATVRPWVYTIANNLARNRLRRERLARWLPLRAVDRQRAAPEPGGRVGSTDEVQRRVAAALASLPERQREACSLRLLGELSLDEIARVTGASVGTVKSRLFYGQRRLRDLLGDLAPGEEDGR
jgi:RNA polymerase sigma-70 factor (ECF subfamily)